MSANATTAIHIPADEIVAVLFMYTTRDKSIAELAAIFNRSPQHIIDCLDLRSNTRIIVEYVPSPTCIQCHTHASTNTNAPPTSVLALTRNQYKKLKRRMQTPAPTTYWTDTLYYTCAILVGLVNVPIIAAMLYANM